jgi:hypothetical protein
VTVTKIQTLERPDSRHYLDDWLPLPRLVALFAEMRSVDCSVHPNRSHESSRDLVGSIRFSDIRLGLLRTHCFQCVILPVSLCEDHLNVGVCSFRNSGHYRQSNVQQHSVDQGGVGLKSIRAALA